MLQQKRAIANETFDEIPRAKVSQLVAERSLDKVTAAEWTLLDETAEGILKKAVNDRKEAIQNEKSERQQWNLRFRRRTMLEVERVPLDLRLEDMIKPYEQILAGVLAVSTLGAGFTFTVIFSGLADPRPGFTTEYVRRCIAASWLLFVAPIGVTNTMAFTAAVLFKPTAFGKSIERSSRHLLSLGLAISWQAMGLMLLPVGAFLASAEAVRA